MAVSLRPHQEKALSEMHNGCILRGGVGTGKTRTALAYYVFKELNATAKVNGIGEASEPEWPTDIYVITTAKKRDDKDWEKEAADFLISTKRSASIGHVQLTVDSWNNIAKYKEITDAFFVFDEQRLVGSGAWVKSFLAIAKKNRWILLSATPGDNWMDYVPVFIANGYYRNRTQFNDAHVVWSRTAKFPKVQRYTDEGILRKHRDEILVEMPYERTTRRHVEEIFVSYDDELYKQVTKKRWHIYQERPLNDMGEMLHVVRRLVNEDTSRLGMVMKLFERHPRLIIFYNYDYELEQLKILGDTLGIPMAQWNGHEHEPVPEGDRWIYLVQYTAGAEGWNCTTTDTVIFYSMNYSYKIFEQAQGRIDRMNTPYQDLWYFVFRSKSDVDQAIRKAIKTKQNFNEKKWEENEWKQAA